MFGREQLGDPIGERGNAVTIPPIKIPSFDNVFKMQAENNALMLQAAKYQQERQAKEAASQMQREKMAQQAAQKAEAEKARKQAAIYAVLKPETDPLMGDMPKLAAEAYNNLLNEASDLYNQGVDINGFDPRAVAFRSGSLLNYQTNYKRHAETAKSFMAKQKSWAENPNEYESYSLAKDDIEPYNKVGWEGTYYPSSLKPFIAAMKDADFYKNTDEYLKFDEQEILNSKGIKSIAGDVYIPKTNKSVPRDLVPLVSNVEYFQNNPNLSPDEIAYKKTLEAQAKKFGAFDDNTNTINAELFAQKYAEIRRPETKTSYVHQNIESTGGGGNANFNFSNGGLVVGGSSKKPMVATWSGKNGTFFTRRFGSAGDDTYNVPSIAELNLSGNFDPTSVDKRFMVKPNPNGMDNNRFISVNNTTQLTSAESRVVRYLPIDWQGNYRMLLPTADGTINTEDPEIKEYRATYITRDKQTDEPIFIDAEAATPNLGIRYSIPKGLGAEIQRKATNKVGVQQPKGKTKTGTGYNRGSLPPSGK